MQVKIFAYGSNMYTCRMKSRILSATPLGRARLPDKNLICNKESKDGSGKANLTDGAGEVWGVLFEIDSADLLKLDNYEKGYDRICLNVLSDDKSLIEAYVYISSVLTKDPRTYIWYKEKIIQGALEHDLPSSYLELLSRIEVKPNENQK